VRSGGKTLTVAAACYEEVAYVRYDHEDAESATCPFSQSTLETCRLLMP
jgi:hypothetical protein